MIKVCTRYNICPADLSSTVMHFKFGNSLYCDIVQSEIIDKII